MRDLSYNPKIYRLSKFAVICAVIIAVLISMAAPYIYDPVSVIIKEDIEMTTAAAIKVAAEDTDYDDLFIIAPVTIANPDVMYAEAPFFPDFGEMFGIALYSDVQSDPESRHDFHFSYRYPAADVTEQMISQYIDSLTELGFTYSTTVGNSNFYQNGPLRIQLFKATMLFIITVVHERQ
jgi:hypothetical protein